MGAEPWRYNQSFSGSHRKSVLVIALYIPCELTLLAEVTENSVRLQLAQEDEAQLREDLTSDIHATLHDDVPPGRLIAQGLELEDHQCVCLLLDFFLSCTHQECRRLLRNEIKGLGPHSTSLQRSRVVERSNRLFRKIEAWISIQVLYMPTAASLRLREDRLSNSEHVATADIKLYLPSAMVDKVYCDRKFQEIEWRLRYAQAHETLYEIRSAILTRSQMYKSKDTLVRGQRMHTRSLALLQTVSSRISNGMARYKQIREALMRLAVPLRKIGWDTILQELSIADVGGITALEDKRSEGSRTISWIWKLSDGDAMEGEGKQEGLSSVC